MNRRGFLFGAGFAAAAASLPGRAIASIAEETGPLIGTVSAATYGAISARTAARATMLMLRHVEPLLVLSKFSQPGPYLGRMVPTQGDLFFTAPPSIVTFRRPKPFHDPRTDR